jgi:hypothetical protein
MRLTQKKKEHSVRGPCGLKTDHYYEAWRIKGRETHWVGGGLWCVDDGVCFSEVLVPILESNNVAALPPRTLAGGR